MLAALVRLQLLRQESNRLSVEVGLYQFVQAVVRQVAYGTLARRDRKAGHLAVVGLLTAAEDSRAEVAAIVAQHYLDAIDAVPEDDDVAELTDRAIGDLRRAASRARSLGAPAEAAGHLGVALERAGEPTLRAQIELDLARALRGRRRPGGRDRAQRVRPGRLRGPGRRAVRLLGGRDPRDRLGGGAQRVRGRDRDGPRSGTTRCAAATTRRGC